MSCTMSKISRFKQVWLSWKALRLPWRKRFLKGLDLDGNTYWEFRDLRGDNNAPVRWRRIVEFPRGTHPGSVQVPPQWHQWLRHTRRDPPSLAEQRHEIARQDRIRTLAAAADARWTGAKKIEGSSNIPGMAGGVSPGPTVDSQLAEPSPKETTTSSSTTPVDPWKQAELNRGNPGQTWQPQAWTPSKR